MKNWSKYNHLFNSEKFGHMLFNSYTNSFISIDNETKVILEELKTNPEKFEQLPESLQKIIIDMKVITEEQPHDALNVMKFISFLCKSDNKNKLLTIAPTIDCNFRCTYCYELNNDNNKKIYMSKDVENAIVDFMIKDHKESQSNFHITWFGGEPLLSFDIMESITEKLLEAEIPFTAEIITNGYLLSKEIILKLEHLKILQMQITIDGNREEHNKKRPHETCSGTYDLIMENIKNLFENTSNVKLSIRVNLDTENSFIFNELKKELRLQFPKANIYPAMIRHVQISDSCKNVSNCMNKNDEVEFFIEQFKQHNDQNINYYPSLKGIDDCTATRLHSWVIGPEGELYKCWNEIGDNSRIIGNIMNNTVHNTTLLNRYLVGIDPTEDEKCGNCFYLPLCGGGCPFQRLKNKYEGATYNTCIKQKGSKSLEKFLEIQYEINMNNSKTKEIFL